MLYFPYPVKHGGLFKNRYDLITDHKLEKSGDPNFKFHDQLPDASEIYNYFQFVKRNPYSPDYFGNLLIANEDWEWTASIADLSNFYKGINNIIDNKINTSYFMTNTAGHFILKPIPPINILNQVESVPENEHLTMQIASQVFGIRTAENAIVYFPDGTPAYITKRFDLRPEGSKCQQEDFAQLTNRSNESHGEHFKYDGTYEEMGQLIKKYEHLRQRDK